MNDDSTELLWHWLRQGWWYRKLSRRTIEEQNWYGERVKHEMSLILEKDFIDFFLATSEVVRWSKDNGIAVGPGRGSAAASVVCWMLRITEIDPGKYPGMVFERFLDVTRVDPPDIDLDFEDERRHEVREHLEEKYGVECVGTIANFVRYRGKNSLDDVGRVHQVPNASTKIVKDLIVERSGGDSRFGNSLEDTVDMFPNAKAIFDAFPSLWLATQLEGNVRGMSVHAAGLVIANSPMTDICATYERDGRQVLSIDKYDADYCGLLKMDFLGLTTMGMIARCLQLTGLTLEDLYAVPDTDALTLDVFRNNDVEGIFQFGGRATRIVNRDVCPDNFAQVADVNALSRPGPLFSGTTATYCAVKHGRETAEHYHPVVDGITADTFGQIIYQEQILKILQVIGGFEWTDLNEIRRIIAKKIGQAAFQVNMDNFQNGAERLHGIKPEVSERIWKHIVTSGTYAFNIAHSVSYSTLSWWCAYLKSHHPVEFFASSLYKAEPGKDSEFKLMKDAQRHGIEILPPDFRYSDTSWGAVMPNSSNPGVLAGFSSVPGIADTIATNIVAARREQAFILPADMTRARGVGLKRVEVLNQFCHAEDPFGLEVTGKIIAKVRAAIVTHEIGAPLPTLDGEDVSAEPAEPWGSKKKSRLITYAGIVKARIYQDVVENIHSRTGDDLADIVANLKRPELRKYCVLQCLDDTMEEVYGRINRYGFPKFRSRLETITVGHDVVIIQGRKSPGFGNSIAVENIWVIDPE
jgi:DNA polymerase-3 subunit alpha